MTGPTGNCSQHCPCGHSDKEARRTPHLVDNYMMGRHEHSESGSDCYGCVVDTWIQNREKRE